MSLFRRLSIRNSAGEWTVESVTARRASSGDKPQKTFNSFMSSHETVTSFDHSFGSTGSCDQQISPANSSGGGSTNADADADAPDATTSNDVLKMKVQLLERQLDQKDKTISYLRHAMESEDERVAMLELQLGRLVEFSSKKVVKYHQGSNIKTEPIIHEKNQDDDNKMEVKALNELLARVIAEKDKLGFENDNMKRLLKEHQDKCNNCNNGQQIGSNMPPTINELDSMIRDKAKQYKQDELKEKSSDNKKDKHKKSSNNKQDKHKKSSRDKPKEEKSISKGTSKVKKSHHHKPRQELSSSLTPVVGIANVQDEQHNIRYQMTCRKCTTTGEDIRYTSSCSAATNNKDDVRYELLKVLKTHYKDVWKIVTELNAHDAYSNECDSTISSIQSDEEWGIMNDFASSSLARHVAEHCLSLGNHDKAEVMKYCMKNVKVEIQKNSVKTDKQVQAESPKKREVSEKIKQFEAMACSEKIKQFEAMACCHPKPPQIPYIEV